MSGCSSEVVIWLDCRGWMLSELGNLTFHQPSVRPTIVPISNGWVPGALSVSMTAPPTRRLRFACVAQMLPPVKDGLQMPQSLPPVAIAQYSAGPHVGSDGARG